MGTVAELKKVTSLFFVRKTGPGRSMTWSRCVQFVALHSFLFASYFRLMNLSKAEIPGQSFYSDFYFNFFVWKEQLLLIKSGFFPFGTFWVRNYLGGIPVSFLPHNGWEDPLNLIGTVLLSVAGDPIIALKILIYGVFIVSLITSFFYGREIIGDFGASMLISIGYTYSIQHFADIYWGHLNLLAGFALIPIALTCWERLLRETTWRNAIFASASLVLIFFVEWQCLFFLVGFLSLRVLWHVGTHKTVRKTGPSLLAKIAGSVLLFCAAVLPFFLNASVYYGSSWTVESLYGVQPSSYFVRPFSQESVLEIPFNYVGLTCLFLALIPVLRRTSRGLANVFDARYGFYLVAACFFVLYSGAGHSPIDVASLVHQLVPFLSSIRVVGRSSILVYLSLSVCAALGYLRLSRHLEKRLARNNIRKLVKGFLPIMLCLIVFLDLTAGFEPRTSESYVPSSSSYDYIKQQPGEFRVVEIPQFWGLSTITSNYIEHEVIDWRRPYLKGHSDFSNVYQEFTNLDDNLLVETSTQPRWNVTSSDNFPEYTLEHSRNTQLGNFLKLSLNSSDNGEFVKLEQTFSKQPEITDDIYFSMTLFTEEFKNATIDIIIELVDNTPNVEYIRYRFTHNEVPPEDPDRFITFTPEPPTFPTIIRRNIFVDLPQSPNGKFRASKIQMILTNHGSSGGENGIEVLIGSIAIYRFVDIITRLSLYGVRYILLHTRWMFPRSIESSFLAEQRLDKIRSYLSLLDGIKLVHNNNDAYVFENLFYKGLVFPTKLNARCDLDLFSHVDTVVNYSAKDPNTLSLFILTNESCRVIISQNFYDKWRATSDNGEFELNQTFGVSSIVLDPGEYLITLHFESYEESLLVFPLFHVPLLSILLLAWVYRLRGRKTATTYIAGFGNYGKLFAEKLCLLWKTIQEVLRSGTLAVSLIALLNLVLVLLFLCTIGKIGGVWEYGVFSGYALYPTALGRMAMLLDSFILIGLTLIFWTSRKEPVLSTCTFVPIITLVSAIVNLHLMVSEYVFASMDIARNDLLLLMPITLFTSSLLVVHNRYGSLSMRRELTIEVAVLRAPIRLFSIIVIIQGVLGTAIEGYFSAVSQWLGYGAFCSLIGIAILNGFGTIIFKKR